MISFCSLPISFSSLLPVGTAPLQQIQVGGLVGRC